MTTCLPETTLRTARASSASRAVRPRAATRPVVAWAVSSVVVLLAWSAAVLITVDGLVRAHASTVAAFAEIGAAALPAIGGTALARRVRRLPTGRTWLWLGALPSLAGWYFLAHLS